LFNAQLALAADFSEEIKSYITNIKSIAVEFEQSDDNGQVAHGMLNIDKPHKFRCNYYEPFPIVIVGNKNYVSVYDYEMENLSRIKSDENIFNFLLVDKVSFDDQFEVLLAKEQGKDYIIKIKHHGLNKISEISFDKESKQIQTMKIFEENNVIEVIGKTGSYIRGGLSKIFTDTMLIIDVSGGLGSVVAMSIQEDKPLLLKTIFTQEMLKRGFLASNLIYVSYAHTQEIVDKYLENAADVFRLIANNKESLEELLESEVSHDGFKRLN
jgi:outer membrane lipoprotein-sorting protein